VAKQMAPDTEPLTITIKKEGDIFIGERTKVEKEELLPRLSAIAKEGYDRRIFIRADEAAPYGAVAEVMAMINAAGYRNLGLVTDPLNAPRRAGAGAEKKQPAPDAPKRE
jgi:biopolymer transport protein TolR